MTINGKRRSRVVGDETWAWAGGRLFIYSNDQLNTHVCAHGINCIVIIVIYILNYRCTITTVVILLKSDVFILVVMLW